MVINALADNDQKNPLIVPRSCAKNKEGSSKSIEVIFGLVLSLHVRARDFRGFVADLRKKSQASFDGDTESRQTTFFSNHCSQSLLVKLLEMLFSTRPCPMLAKSDRRNGARRTSH